MPTRLTSHGFVGVCNNRQRRSYCPPHAVNAQSFRSSFPSSTYTMLSNTQRTRLSISLSGSNNIGKTTLLNLIPRSWPITTTGPIHDYDDPLASMVMKSPNDTFKGWWLGSSTSRVCESDEGLVKMLARSCTARHAAATLYEEGTNIRQVVANGVTVNLPGSLLDCSSIMFEAVCSARIATVRSIPLPEAEHLVQSILLDSNASFPSETISIVQIGRAHV